MNVAVWQQSNILPHGAVFEKNATDKFNHEEVTAKCGVGQF